MSATVVTGDTAAYPFRLRFVPASVVENNTWTDTQIASSGGGGITAFGFGFHSAPRIRSNLVARQRVAIRAAGQDIFIDRSGEPLPIAAGQSGELVYLAGQRTGQEAPVAFRIAATGRWHWLTTPAAAGALARPTTALIREGLAYLSATAAILAGMWFLFVRGHGFLPWALLIVLGLPTALGLASPLMGRAAASVARAAAAEISARR